MKRIITLIIAFCGILSFSACAQPPAAEEPPQPPETTIETLGTVALEDLSDMTATSTYSGKTAPISKEDAQKIADLLNGQEIISEFPALDPDWQVTLDTETTEIVISDGIIGIYHKDQKEIAGCLASNNVRDTTLAQILAKYGLIPYDGPLPPETEIQTAGTIQMEEGGSFQVSCAYPEESSAPLNETDSSEIVSLLNGKELINEFSACDSDLTLKYGDWTFIIHTSCGSVGAYHGELEGSCELSDAEISALRGILVEYEINTEG